MWIDSVRNTGVLTDQIISGATDVDVEELSLTFQLAVRSRVYVNAILTVVPEDVAKGEKLIGKIQLESEDGPAEPRQYGPYGYRSSDPQAQHSFVADIDFELAPGDHTVSVLASISDTGSDSYRLRPQGNCRMTVIALPKITVPPRRWPGWLRRRFGLPRPGH